MTEANKLQYQTGKIMHINNDLVEISGIMFHAAGKKAKETLKTMAEGQVAKFGYDPAKPTEILWLGNAEVKAGTITEQTATAKVEMPQTVIPTSDSAKELAKETQMTKPLVVLPLPPLPVPFVEPIQKSLPIALTNAQATEITRLAETPIEKPCSSTKWSEMDLYMQCMTIAVQAPEDYRNPGEKPAAVIKAADRYYEHVVNKFKNS